MCILEKDEKTFKYFKDYFMWLENTDKDCFSLDNEIQYYEIKTHLSCNGKCEDDINESLEWIHKNGHDFRDYLNTIKILYVAIKFKDPDSKIEDIQWEHFCKMSDVLNSYRKKLNVL